MNENNMKEAVEKLSAALDAVDASTELLTKVKEDIKEDYDINPNALVYAIRRARKKKLGSETIDTQDELYTLVYREELV